MTSASRTPTPRGEGLLLRRLQGPTNLTKLKPHSPAEFPELAVQLHPLTSDRFHALFTLSSKYFSTFPHGTCLLSVLWRYLALDRVYDLLSAACSSNATLREKRPSPHSFNTRPHGSYTLRGVFPAVSWDSLFVADLEFAWLWGLTTTFPFTQHSAAGRVAREVLRWAHPCSVAPTKGIPYWFLFLRLLICLSSAGNPF